MPPIRREWSFGENTAYFEPPDVLWTRFKGPCDLSVAMQLVDICRELGSSRPFFLLGDMEEAGAMDAEARRYFIEHFQSGWLGAIITYRTRLLHKALMMGLRLAIEINRSEESAFRDKIHFVSTREQAQALLARLRPRPE